MFSKIKYFLFDSYHRPTQKFLHIFVFFRSFFFNKKTNIFSERMFLLKNPPNSTIYYNFFGRIFIMISNFVAIILFNKFFNKKTFIDNGIKRENISSILEGNDESSWPIQSLIFLEESNTEMPDREFFQYLEKNYVYTLRLVSAKTDLEEQEWWKTCREEYKENFWNNDTLNLSALENFRAKTKTSSAILNDGSYLKTNTKRLDKIKALSLINLYHKISEYTELEILRQASDSFVGKNICLNYRNQRLSHAVLRHSYFCSQILKFTQLDQDKHNIIVDIGGGYGGLIRLLKYYFKKSTLIIFEIPEATILAAYFLKRNFPEAKIGQAFDFKDINRLDSEQIKKFDFIILPQPNIEKISDDIVDLCINTISMGEMTNNTQNYYLENIERITKDYFYSVNRPKKRSEKYNAQGFYSLNFKKKWITKIYNYTHTYHIEFLGKKSRNAKI